MERLNHSEEYSHLITAEEREELSRLLGAYGLVDALLFDMPEDKLHTNDERWAVELDSNPDIILGNN